ncbi:hypothetical protein LX97_02245 [Nonlabens dokdonensis]|jgi:hypothetical protein|uniref:Lipoprotein n=2 Tax=Nonlabens dokdonensis TaxID=328515 RepID=L7W795_NONDD|nr:hypothetical protein [Nonlabens dokdonensis]AGC77560.1 hypothetical protein DDD_2433 [Nonlabens dokdonensis DSW-6]PZX39887.1 hypothetical protein LX97_02245 [Nonlabens dokdonensis]
MKYLAVTIFSFLCVLFTGCDTHTKDYSDLESISFYNHEGNEITMEELKKDWNETITRASTKDASYEQEIKELKIETIRDNSSNEDYLILVASTSNSNAFSGKVISSFKDGFQLPKETVTCINCGSEFKGELVDGTWICADNGDKIDGCVRASTTSN